MPQGMSQWAYAVTVGRSSRPNTDGSFGHLGELPGTCDAPARPHCTAGPGSDRAAELGSDVAERDLDVHRAADVERLRLADEVADERWEDLDREVTREHRDLEAPGHVGVRG